MNDPAEDREARPPLGAATQLRRAAKVLGVVVLLAVAFAGAWAAWMRVSIRSEEIAFKSGALTLRGTLLTPRFRKSAPAVVLVAGSGQSTRRSTMPYAWILAGHGYAALAYDKRGVGKSDGPADAWDRFSLEELGEDAAAAYRYVQSSQGIDPSRIGFLGASQGAWVVSEAANRVETPAFLIMISASFSTVAEDRLDGRRAMVRHMGGSEAEARNAVELMHLDHQVTRTGTGFEQLRAAFEQQRSAPWFKEGFPEGRLLPADDPQRAWERTVLDFDPAPRMARVSAPVLWIYGDPKLDRFAPVPLSLSRIRSAQAHGKPYAVIQIPGADHKLDLEGRGGLESLVKVRIPLVLKIYRWLDSLPSGTGSRA